MPKLKPSDIVKKVRKVLLNAQPGGPKEELSFLSAYQILDRLPVTTKARLIRERGLGGKGTGNRYAAASVASDAAELVEDVEVRYLDTKTIVLTVNDEAVVPSPKVCGIFRLKRA